jgi:hypothetical protein
VHAVSPFDQYFTTMTRIAHGGIVSRGSWFHPRFEPDLGDTRLRLECLTVRGNLATFDNTVWGRDVEEGAVGT